MSNAFLSTQVLADPSATVAGKEIIFTTPDRMAQSINYSFATGACHNALSQGFADRVFIQGSTFMTEMAQWRIPLVSREHTELEVVLNYRLHGTSTACNAKIVLDVGANSAISTINLPTSTNGIVNDTLTIIMPSSTEYYATVTLELQGDGSAADAEIFSIMARWKRIGSPIPGGEKTLYNPNPTNKFRPFGTTNRTGADRALSSRFGYNMIDNIEIVRGRLRSYFTWSGVYSALSNQFGSTDDAAAPCIYAGPGDINRMVGYPLFPSGWEELTQAHKLKLHVRAIGDVTFDFMGNEIVVDQATSTTVGWSVFDLDIDQARLSELGDVNLPYYHSSFDFTSANVTALSGASGVFTTKYPTVDANNSGAILGISLMGV